MKLSSIILSLILTLLSCLPCTDGISSGDNFGHSDVAEQHSKSSDENHSDLCSPFCICNCCGIQVLNFVPSEAFVVHESFTAFIVKPQTIYKSHLASMFSGSIWQPPQIA